MPPTPRLASARTGEAGHQGHQPARAEAQEGRQPGGVPQVAAGRRQDEELPEEGGQQPDAGHDEGKGQRFGPALPTQILKKLPRPEQDFPEGPEKPRQG